MFITVSYIKVYLPFVLLCIILNHQSFLSKSTGNKMDSIYRMNDKFHRAFKNNEILNNHSNGKLKQSNKTQKTNKTPETIPQESLTEELNEPKIYNKTNGTKYKAIVNGNKLNNTNDKCSCKCNCSCGLHEDYQQLMHLYAFDEEEEDSDEDDLEELEKIQKPYKYIPMETIELAHQRPTKVITTSTTPSPPLKNLISSVNSYLTSTTISMGAFAQLGLSLMLTVLVGTLIGPIKVIANRHADNQKHVNRGFYGKFYPRFNNYSVYNEDPFLLIYEWLQKFDQ